jgi:ADP-ribose pyrophosphatase
MSSKLNFSNFSDFTSNDVKIISKETVFHGFFTMNRYQIQHKLFDGSTSRVIQREMFERGHAVAVLPYDPDTEEFVLIEQFRLGAMETCESPWLIEVIAGMIDEGETPEAVCHREAREESNIELTGLTKALTYLSSPGGTTERIHIFIGKTDATKAGGVYGLESESEDIKVHRVKEGTARAWLESGRIDNAAAIIALQWFFLNKARLIESW